MIENSRPISANFELHNTDNAEALWAEHDLSTKQAAAGVKRILLVEDQESVRAALRMMLELDGHQVTEASNGAEALKSFRDGEFDLIVTDFEMPLMKGNELAISIKSLAPSMPILMITASERACGNLENPVDALLNKPLTVTELRHALGRLLSVRKESAQPSVPALERPSVTFASEGQMVAPLA